jgi:hypothetical protein
MGTCLVVSIGSMFGGGARYADVVASRSLDSDTDVRGAWMWALGSKLLPATTPLASRCQS